MPTILRLDGLRIVVYPNDHRPPHVHVIGPGAEAVFLLDCPEGPPMLRESVGFRTVDLERISSHLQERIAALCGAWSEIHDR